MKSKPFAVLAVLALIVSPALAQAQGPDRCRVMDPTGTPLNVRTAPNDAVVGQLRNGVLVSVRDTARDGSGRSWALVEDFNSGRRYGWVFREFLSCF